MATQWVLGKVSEALAPTVSGAVAGAGSFVGGAVNAVGNGINGVGESINSSIRQYGDGAKDYGNAIMDWTRADGIRAATAANPLGLSAPTTGGKRQVTNPHLYRPPAINSASKTATPQKKIEAAPARKALPAPPTAGPKPMGAKKAPSAAAPAKKPVSAAPVKASLPKSTPAPIKASTTPNPGAFRKKAEDNKKPGTTNGAAKAANGVKKTPVKASTASVPKTTTPAKQQFKLDQRAAANPLGLTF